MNSVYYGQIKCQSKLANGKDCRNGAYYLYRDKYVCGVHSRAEERVVLQKNPLIKQNQKAIRDKEIDDTTKENVRLCNYGSVIMSKLTMRSSIPHVPTYLSVQPNFRKKDGFGNLSPRSLGPVYHVMPNLPPAGTVEDYYQQAKFWQFELDTNGSPTIEAHINRQRAYRDGKGIRHKHSGSPEYSIFYDINGIERRYN